MLLIQPVIGAFNQAADLFRPYALVKSTTLLRDPYSNLSTNLAYVEFHSVEHAQYALTSYRDAHRDAHRDAPGSQGRGNQALASAAFAETKAMLRLQREVDTIPTLFPYYSHKSFVVIGAPFFVFYRRLSLAVRWPRIRW